MTTASHEKSRTLRRTLEHTALEQLIEAFHNEEIDAARICKLFQAFCEFRKHDVAEDKNKASVQVARLRHANTKGRKPSAADGDESLTAPYGRKPTGEPYTRSDFLHAIRKTVRDLYGLDFDPTEPKSEPPRAAQSEPARAGQSEPGRAGQSEPGRAGPVFTSPLTKPDTRPP
ncbi:MAG: hypothetical protein MI923_15210 [Phycisphaerales bacterium]|nr:hypothetical protein [Phycisphaerales bacterium]